MYTDYEVDDLEEERIILRSDLLEVAINEYKSQLGDLAIPVVSEASDKIAALYFEVKKHHAQEFIPGRMNRFKMAALTSHCIVKVQPLIHADARRINADLAVCTALSIMHTMPPRPGQAASRSLLDLVDSINNAVHDEWVRNEVVQHQKWLCAKNVNIYPVFCGGAFLSLLWLYGSLRYQVLSS